MNLLEKGGKHECFRHGNPESQKNFHSPSPVSNLGSLNPKCPRIPIAMAAAQYIQKCGQRRRAKPRSEGLKGSLSLIEKPIHWRIVVQKSHDEFYILISLLELQKTTCLTKCSSFPWLEVLWVMCSNEFQIVLLCTNHTLVKPILNLA
jgi:hypothetical protein